MKLADLYSSEMVGHANTLTTKVLQFLADEEDHIAVMYLALAISLVRMHAIISKTASEIQPLDPCEIVARIAQALDTTDEHKH